MAQYKVPQDVEADDKLLGPFTFRQFIYLIVCTGMIALAWALAQIFPLLIIIPVPIILFFGALALPLKKDQPMETYFAALVSFYLKPRKRLWEPGQAESTIRITAPKKVEVNRVKDISQDEASHRLSFLAEIVDTEGQAIKSATGSPIREEVQTEANSATDMFETYSFANQTLDKTLQSETTARHQAAVQQMKAAIESANSISNTGAAIQKFSEPVAPAISTATDPISSATILPTLTTPISAPVDISTPTQLPEQTAPPISDTVILPTAPDPTPPEPTPPSPALVDLAHDQDLSVQTIAQEANRLQQKQDEEVIISLR